MTLQAVAEVLPDAAGAAPWLNFGTSGALAWIAWRTYRLLARLEARLEAVEIQLFGGREDADPLDDTRPALRPLRRSRNVRT